MRHMEFQYDPNSSSVEILNELWYPMVLPITMYHHTTPLSDGGIDGPEKFVMYFVLCLHHKPRV